MEQNYYIYIYLDLRKSGNFIFEDLKFDFEPFYVGMGKDERYKAHLKNSLLQKNSLKNNKIKKLLNLGFDPMQFIIFYKRDISENEAEIIEKQLIKKIGRSCEKNGPLTNIASGGKTDYKTLYDKNWLINNTKAREKPVYRVDPKTYEIIDEFSSTTKAAEFLGIGRSSINNMLSANQPTKTAGGFLWVYKKDYEKMGEKAILIKRSISTNDRKSLKKPTIISTEEARLLNINLIDESVTKGVHNARAKLTDKQITEIKNSKESKKIIAKKYGISQAYVSTILSGKIWTHIK